jgi:hypothetical protein
MGGWLRICTAGLLAFLLSSSIACGGVRAEAASRRQVSSEIAVGNYTTKYHKNWTFKSRHLKRCVYITASGSFSYTLSKNSGGRGQTIDYWTKQKLHDPTISIRIIAMGARARCLSSARVTTAQLQQDWTGYACSFNPSLGFTAPWGVSLSGWPSCGQRHQVGYETDPPGSHSSYHQYNSGSPASFGDWSRPFTSKDTPCYGVYPTIILGISSRSGGSTDSYGAGDALSKEVCLPWHGSPS